MIISFFNAFEVAFYVQSQLFRSASLYITKKIV